ncbi:DUF192 domain-containing protein [Alphaproteobacteria bacterium]|nr:DUF192 domain-containing protein [Alphaproteobacteria bacterium]
MPQQVSHQQFQRIWRLLAAVVMVVATSWPVAAENIMRSPDYAATQIQLLPAPNRQPIIFDVRLAKTPAQQAYGLMFSPPLVARTGMLFIFAKDGPRSFWMKNTPISLDMLFFDSNGGLVSIIANAEPFSLTERKSQAAAQYVLEIGGGEAARLGLGPLTRLHLPVEAAVNSAGSQEK